MSSLPPSAPKLEPKLESVPGIPQALPLGFVFWPNDQEMVSMLRDMVAGMSDDTGGILVPGFQLPPYVDISLFDPHADLPGCKEIHGQHISFFYTTVSKGDQRICSTGQGIWKRIVKDKPIKERADRGPVVGYKKKFAYHADRACQEDEDSVYVMEEVRMNPRLRQHMHLDIKKMQSMVMCKVYNCVEEETWKYGEITSESEEEVAATLDREFGSS